MPWSRMAETFKNVFVSISMASNSRKWTDREIISISGSPFWLHIRITGEQLKNIHVRVASIDESKLEALEVALGYWNFKIFLYMYSQG